MWHPADEIREEMRKEEEPQVRPVMGHTDRTPARCQDQIQREYGTTLPRGQWGAGRPGRAARWETWKDDLGGFTRCGWEGAKLETDIG